MTADVAFEVDMIVVMCGVRTFSAAKAVACKTIFTWNAMKQTFINKRI